MGIKKVGFIGLGDMGLGMALNLINQGFALTTCTHTRRENIEIVKHSGAEEVSSPEEVARGSEAIITVVRDGPQTDDLIFGPHGIWAGLSKGTILILCSTLLPSHCQRITGKAKEKGVHVLDAPVSGSRPASQSGTLTFMVGGDKVIFQECLPLFEAMGKNVFHLGETGMGQAFKLVNNITFFLNMVAVSEGVAFGLKAGLNLDQMLEILEVSTGNSWAVQNYHLMAGYRKGFQEQGFASPNALMYKDMDLALSYAREMKSFPLPFLGLLSQTDISFLFPENVV